MATRLQDIADDLGISKVTVSKVLRGSSDVGEETRRRVKKRVRELGYQPNYQARALAGGKTFSIGLIVPDLVHPFFAEVAKGLGSSSYESASRRPATALATKPCGSSSAQNSSLTLFFAITI